MFFVFLFSLVAFLFRAALSINFFSDDFFFLKISRVSNLSEFLNLFYPDKDYFYRPLATEFFYYEIHLLGKNAWLGHGLAFLVFFIGVYYLYRSILHLSGNKILSYIAVFLYAINSVHVFQLYFLATFQEIALFTLLCFSFFNFLRRQHFLSLVAFVFALMSKETATLFLPFLLVFSLVYNRMKKINGIKNRPVDWKTFVPYLVIALVFALIYRSGINNTVSLENYRIQPDMKLALNNFIWYFLWSWGFPDFTPNYLTSLISYPPPQFWKLLNNFPSIKVYFIALTGYLSLFIIASALYLKKTIKHSKDNFLFIFFCLSGFTIFVGPVLFVLHRWMVRLTVPLIFIVLIQAFIIYAMIKSSGKFKVIGVLLMATYIILNIMAIPIYESSSTYLLESRISDNLGKLVDKNRQDMVKHKYIYFRDIPGIDAFGQSRHLKTTLSDQNFLDHYLNGVNIKAVYGFENGNAPNNSYIINSVDLFAR